MNSLFPALAIVLGLLLLSNFVLMQGARGRILYSENINSAAKSSNSIQASVRSSAPQAQEWNITSPIGMNQLFYYDQYAANGLIFRMYGWNYTGTISNGTNSVQILPLLGAKQPANMLEGQGTFIDWTLTPMGDIRTGPVIWQGNTTDSGYTLFDILQGGLFNAYYANVPTNAAIDLVGSSAPVSIGSGRYQLGSIGIRIINGTISLGKTSVISPVANTIHFIVYTNYIYNNATIDKFGAAVNQVSGEVSQYQSFTTQKSMKVVIPALNINEYTAINPINSVGTGVLYEAGSENATLFVVNSTGYNLSESWGIVTYVASAVRQSGVDSQRRFQYEFGNYTFATHTFDMYVSDSIGTEELESVDRIVQPYTISYYPASNAFLFYFPSTQADMENGAIQDAMNTIVAWGFQNSNATVVTSENVHTNIQLSNTGEAGDSVDLGFRHYTTTGSATEVLVRSPSGSWDVFRNPSLGYYYPSGNAGYAIGSINSFFTMGRVWQGYWASTSNAMAIYQRADSAGTILGFMKNQSGGTTPAHSNIIVDQVVVVYKGNSTIPTNMQEASEYNKYSVAANVPLLNGMVNLGNSSAYTSAPWDIGIINNIPTIFNTNVYNITNTTTISTISSTTTSTSTQSTTQSTTSQTTTITQNTTTSTSTSSTTSTSTKSTTSTSTRTTTSTSSTTTVFSPSITVKSINEKGNTISGYKVVLYNGKHTSIGSASTPKTFSGLTYQATYFVQLYSGTCKFVEWQSNGSTNATMKLTNITSSVTLTGIYKC